MANIKVPIGRGLLSQPEFKKQPELKATNDLEFKKLLADQGKLTTAFAAVTNSGSAQDLVTFTPPNGSTFYLLGATGEGSTGGTAFTVRLRVIINGVISDIKAFSATGPANFDVTEEGFSLVGNGTNQILIRLTTTGMVTESTIFGYLESSPTTSSRGSTTVDVQ